MDSCKVVLFSFESPQSFGYADFMRVLSGYPHVRLPGGGFFVETQESAKELWGKLQMFIGPGEELIVFETREYGATTKEDVARWIQERTQDGETL